ncbi:MAG TPA: 4Fe-4S double cluster binding domain-containing protein [Spirochaetota bacterium]|nr:4Fe-4S double cluster binding domain-containing protein [Spirochaetota bacterium]
MLSKQEIIDKARELQFDDIGFATAEPFEEHKQFLTTVPDNFTWARVFGLPLEEGCNPQSILPQAKTIIVLIENYFKFSFPKSMEPYFGRCYMDDDRVTKDGLTVRIRQFVSFLREHGLQAKVTFSIPQKAASARAGIGNFGKNCLLYANNAAGKSSWISPITILVDKAFEADEPTVRVGCPDWCRNACVAACPTRALKGNCTIDSKRCISFLTYFGQGITPRELREPMGTYIYGCDRCQDVCPRNRAWMSQVLPLNPRVAAKEPWFDIVKLLHMDDAYFQHNIQPHMFYMPASDLWRWKMNVARAMGNSLNERFVPELIKAYEDNSDDRVRGMIAWSLGRIGGAKAKAALERWRHSATPAVKEEIEMAL